jgi:hypothetical protein
MEKAERILFKKKNLQRQTESLKIKIEMSQQLGNNSFYNHGKAIIQI